MKRLPSTTLISALDSATYTERGLELQEIIIRATHQYIYRQIDLDGFQDAMETWKNRGGQEIIEEFNASYRAAQ